MSDDKLIRLSDAIAALRSADLPFGYGHAAEVIRALPAVQVGVKPLEWVEIRSGQYFEARVIGILYSVRLGTDGIARWQAGHMGTWHEAPTIEAAKAAAQADYDARIRSALTAQPSPDVAAQFDSADWYWRTMDPDDCGDSPSEAIQRGMVGCFCVCEIASSFTGPTRYGFIAPVLDPESDDEEFVHFATQQEAMDAAKDRAAIARLKGGAA